MNNTKPATTQTQAQTLTKYRIALTLMFTLCIVTAAYYEIRLMFKSDLAELTKRHSVEVNRLQSQVILLEQRISDVEQRNRHTADRVEALNAAQQRNYQQLWEQINTPRQPIQPVQGQRR
jgi:hypothetical protein